MRTMTIRDVPQELADALEREKRIRGQSLNKTVIALLKQGLGVGETRSNGLARLAGQWSDEEFRQFEGAVGTFEQVDHELWG